MDPLGAVVHSVCVKTLQRWHQTEVPDYGIVMDNPEKQQHSPFCWSDDINRKIVLWSGDITLLDAEAVVNSTNEWLSDKTPDCERLMRRAGNELRQEIKRDIKVCKTGEAKLTKGYKLPARHVIHTVGPKYNIKYKTAAESALFSCYRRVMQVAKEHHISSLAFQCIHSRRRGYPSSDGAHIGIRTVRRFLEKHGEDINTVVFVVSGEDEDVYRALLPLYFPRNKTEEDYAGYHLPYDVGNEDGEPVIPERQIRIIGKPTLPSQRAAADVSELEESVNINEAFDMSTAVGAHDFAKMEGDIDKERKRRIQKTEQDVIEEEQQKRYQRWLRRARLSDLADIRRLNCIYQSGTDLIGRPVVVVIGRNLPQTVSRERALLYFIQTMENVVQKNYVMVYFHTLTDKNHSVDTQLLRDIFEITDQKYKHNLNALYIVHPTFWTKVMGWFFTTFTVSNIKHRIKYIPGLEYLHQRISPDQLELPNFILDYDVQVNGTRYFDPDEDQAIGAL